MRHLVLAASLAMPVPLAAQERAPSEIEVITTFVREAPTLTMDNPLNSAAPEDAATLFLTEVLYELGVYDHPEGDSASLYAGCDEELRPGTYFCHLSLGIRWGDAESGVSVFFEMERTDRPCETQRIGALGETLMCQWHIPGSRAEFLHAG